MAAAGQIALQFAFIVFHVADRHTVVAGVHGEVDRRRLWSNVTRFIFNRDFPGVVTVRQSRCRGVAPVTAAIYRHAHGSAITQIDDRGTVRVTLTTVGWGVIVGGTVIRNNARRAEVVPQFNVRRCQRFNGVHNNHPLPGFRAAVAHGVFRHRAEAVLALRKCSVEINGPGATRNHSATDRCRVSAVIQVNGRPVLTRTGDGRFVIVGDATLLYGANMGIDIIDYVRDCRCRRNAACYQLKRERVRRFRTQTRFVFGNHFHIVVPVRQRRRRRPGPFTCRVSGNGIHFLTVNNDVHQTVFLSGTGKGRGAVIGDLAVGQVACFQARIIKHAIDRRFYRRRGVYDETDRIGRIAVVTHRIGDHHDRFMFAFRQRFLRGHFPLAVITDNCGTHNFVVNNQTHGVARCTLVATEHRLGVVGGVTIENWTHNRPLVVFNVTNDRLVRALQIHDKFEIIRRFAGVAFRIGNDHFPGVATFRQRFLRGHCPLAVVTDDRRPHQFIVHDQSDGIARRAVFTAERRLRIVSRAAVLDWAHHGTGIIFYFADDRFFWRNDKFEVIRRFAVVSGRIGDDHLPGVTAFRQRFLRRHLPFTVFTDDRSTDHFVVNDQAYGIARRSTFTAEDRLFIVSRIAVVDWACFRANIVFHFANNRLNRGFQIDGEIKRVARRAGAAIRAFTDQHNAVVAVRQRGFRRPGPFAISTHASFTQLFVIFPEFNNVARSACTAKRWCRVIGHAVLRDRANFCAVVVVHVGQHRGSNRRNGAFFVTAIVTVMTNNGAQTYQRTNPG